MKKLLFVFLLGSGLLACKSKSTTSTLNDVIPTSTLSSELVQLQEPILLPLKILTINDYLIIYNKGNEDIFKVYKLPNIEYLYSFGKIGKGPREFQHPDPNSMIIVNNKLTLFDRNRIVTIDIREKDWSIYSEEPVFMAGIPLNNVVLMNDTSYMFDNMESKFEHQIYNLKNRKLIKEFGEYPDEVPGINSTIDKFQTYIKSSVVQPQKALSASFYLFFNKAKLYSNGNLVKVVEILDKDSKKYLPEKNSDNIIFRAEAIATDSNIYTLGIKQSKNSVTSNPKKFKPTLEIWDWNLNLLKKYYLNQPVIFFCYSEKYNKIYGVNPEDISSVYVFDIPGSNESNIKTQTVNNNIRNFQLIESFIYAPQVSPENEKDFITEARGYLLNENIFIPKPADDFFKGTEGSLTISMRYPKDNPNISLKEFSDLFGKGVKNQKAFKLQDIKLRGVPAKFVEFTVDNEYPGGITKENKFTQWLWFENGLFFSVTVASINKIEAYNDIAQKVISTLKIKPENEVRDLFIKK